VVRQGLKLTLVLAVVQNAMHLTRKDGAQAHKCTCSTHAAQAHMQGYSTHTHATHTHAGTKGNRSARTSSPSRASRAWQVGALYKC
jgi:hypothetical protein